MIELNKAARSLTANGFTEGTTLSFNKNETVECDEIIECNTYTSKNNYSEEECLEYSTRNDLVQWNDGDLVETKNWKIGETILLIIGCSNGTKYTSYQTVEDMNHLRPTKIYDINDGKSFMALGKNNKIYFNEFIER